MSVYPRKAAQVDRAASNGGFITVVCLLCFLTGAISLGLRMPAAAASRPTFHCIIIVSQKIRPYMDAVHGMQTHFQEASEGTLDVFFMELDAENPYQRLTQTLKGIRFDLAIAVGPEAMQYVWSTFPGKGMRKLFCMVLDPENVVHSKSEQCGVPLNIPASVQLQEFMHSIPSLKRIGLVYNPVNNAKFAAAAVTATHSLGIDLVGLKVVRRSELLPVLRRQLKEIDALWVIPDRTVVSESLIPFIIKEAMANNVAVFGYNRFFSDAGAAISLVREYERIGRQTAAMALRWIAGNQECQIESPYFNILINPHVLKALGYPSEPVAGPSAGQGMQ